METSSGGTEVMIQPMIQWVLSLFSFYALNYVKIGAKAGRKPIAYQVGLFFFFCLHSSFYSLWHKFNKVLESLLRDFGAC